MRKDMKEQVRQKKCQWFLGVSLTIFAFVVITFLLYSIPFYLDYRTMPQDNTIDGTNNFAMSIFVMIWMIIPIFAMMLCFIRSVYKILKYEPQRGIKICYVLSALLALCAFVFEILILSGLINLEKVLDIPNLTATMLLLTGWPIFLISFILGSLPTKHNDSRRK